MAHQLKKLKLSLFCLTIIIGLAINSIVSCSLSQEVEILPLFSFVLIMPPYTSNVRLCCVELSEQLAQLNIDAKVKMHSWADILPRTWEYPVGQEYNIVPTYDEGGFDMFFLGWTTELNWDPTKQFSTRSIVPNGDNFYQYSNKTFDQLSEQYLSEYEFTNRKEKLTILQEILYEDLPSIPVFYPRAYFGVKNTLTGLDPILLSNFIERYEFWDDVSDHKVLYAIPASLNAFNCFDTYQYYYESWMSAVYAGLFTYSQGSHEFEPLIAKNYTISADGKDITVDINPEAKFSDGNPVTAEDVKYSYQLYMTPISGLQTRAYKELVSLFEDNNSIEIIDQDTIIFHLKQPYAFVFRALSFGIIEKAKVEPTLIQYGYEIFKEPPLTGNVSDALVTSCGPFVLKNYNFTITNYRFTVHNITLEPNLYYAGNFPKLSQLLIKYIDDTNIALSELESGIIDIISSEYFCDYDDIKNIGATPLIVKSTDYHEFAINMKHPILGTGELTPVGTPEAAKWIRQAISHATSRDKMIEEYLYGAAVPASLPLGEACVGFDDTLSAYSYDLNLSKQLLEKAGYELEISTNTTPTSSAFAVQNFLIFAYLSVVAFIAWQRKNKYYNIH